MRKQSKSLSESLTGIPAQDDMEFSKESLEHLRWVTNGGPEKEQRQEDVRRSWVQFIVPLIISILALVVSIVALLKPAPPLEATISTPPAVSSVSSQTTSAPRPESNKPSSKNPSSETPFVELYLRGFGPDHPES